MTDIIEREETEPTYAPDHGPRYVIGIDLGTTNSAMSYVDLAVDIRGDEAAARRPIQLFDVPQLVAPGEVAARHVLPSFLYLPGAYDMPAGATALPWDPQRGYIVGELAREQGARVPGRLVSSAKSWLSHGQVDRTAPILPWGAEEDVPQVSPIEAASRYLQHLREAWDARMVTHALSGEDALANGDSLRFDAQHIVLTVPASFDEVARELTLEAAREAGMPHAVLLEEPLAAFYAWLARHEVDWQQRMRDGQIILVCDVGGGTTDFTLVGIRAGASGLRFDRLAVGEHLMLGGDNMDYTLGRKLEAQLFGRPGALDAQRWHKLVHQCRSAKERLLGDAEDVPDRVEIAVTGTGSALVGGTRSGTLTRHEVQGLILEGFFPHTALDDVPAQSRRSGLTELGLPYEQEAAIPRHLAAFWNRFEELLRKESGRDDIFPDFVLFNGGALTPLSVRKRILSQIGDWFCSRAGNDWEPQELHNPHPELAVARGAAYYGLVREGLGVRVGSGSPRTYYVGVGGSDDIEQTAVCLVPRGTEEGFSAQLDEVDFEALTNQPVAFHILASSTRTGDELGRVVDLPPDEVTELPPIRTVLRYGRSGEARALPITLGVHLTEVGTLDLYCASRQTDHRWQLQFDVRQSAAAGEEGQSVKETLEQEAVETAQSVLVRTFEPARGTEPLPVASLRRNLEEAVALPKEHWPTPLIRSLADTLLDVAQGRAQSAEHEARWLNTLGFCLRPGFGDPVDEWRMKRAWKLFFDGPLFPRHGSSSSEWWIFWRRISGGLNAGQQNELYQLARPYLQPSKQRRTPRYGLAKHISQGEMLEVWMMLGNLERLPAAEKEQMGDILLGEIGDGPARARELWSLSRFGARTPVYGPVDRVIANEKAAVWLESALAQDLEVNDATAQALVLLARRTGDRVRDIPEANRESLADWLAQLPHAERWLQLLRDPSSSLRQEEEEWIFGESLPSGLVLSAAVNKRE